MAVLRIVLALVMTAARLIPFLLVILLLVLVWRRAAGKQDGPDEKGPAFKGPVVTVRYKEVKDEDKAESSDSEEEP